MVATRGARKTVRGSHRTRLRFHVRKLLALWRIVRPREHASQTFDGSPTQYLGASWEEPLDRELFVVDHLNREPLFAYGRAMLPAFQAALEGRLPDCFVTRSKSIRAGLWSPALWDEFASETGYRLEPFCDALDRQLDVRYDYRKFLAGVMVREFYAPFTQLCHEQGASRACNATARRPIS